MLAHAFGTPSSGHQSGLSLNAPRIPPPPARLFVVPPTFDYTYIPLAPKGFSHAVDPACVGPPRVRGPADRRYLISPRFLYSFRLTSSSLLSLDTFSPAVARDMGRYLPPCLVCPSLFLFDPWAGVTLVGSMPVGKASMGRRHLPDMDYPLGVTFFQEFVPHCLAAGVLVRDALPG